MKRLRSRLAIAFITSTLCGQADRADAQQRVREVNCEEGETVQHAVDRARAGDVIRIFGTCQEHVRIVSSKTALQLVAAHAGAGITGSMTNRPVIEVRSATGISIRGLTIKGPGLGDAAEPSFEAVGIVLFDGASADIANCVVENTGAVGIQVNSANAVLNHNTITKNNLHRLFTGGGVQVTFNGTAKFLNNVIEANHGQGVVLNAQSFGWFLGNTVQGNDGNGLTAFHMSLGDFFAGGNTFSNNAAFGVKCDQESRIAGMGFTASGNASGDVACAFTR